MIAKHRRGEDIPDLIIRADADSDVGAGHVMRCLSLASGWTRMGGNSVFLGKIGSTALRGRVEREGFERLQLERTHPDPLDLETTLRTLHGRALGGPGGECWLALDGYRFCSAYQEAIKAAGFRLLVLDDNAHLARYHADLLLNQNLGADTLSYSADHDTHCLLGPRYALLRPEFCRWKNWARNVPASARNLLITMGGADPANVTLKVVQALRHLNAKNLDVRVVVGSENPNSAILHSVTTGVTGVQLLAAPKDMPSLMAWADVAVSAGGSTCWELAFMGLPSLTIILADNQRLNAELLDDAGVSTNLGCHESLSSDQIAQGLKVLLESTERLDEMARLGRALIDGKGVDRVLDAITARDDQIKASA
jgi:UDP-2,4-diacetamido-2,4,6-trideoxy-beta-L-altropyranose hydrolase